MWFNSFKKHLEIFLLTLVIILTCYALTKDVDNNNKIYKNKYRLLGIPIIFIILEGTIYYYQINTKIQDFSDIHTELCY